MYAEQILFKEFAYPKEEPDVIESRKEVYRYKQRRTQEIKERVLHIDDKDLEEWFW